MINFTKDIICKYPNKNLKRVSVKHLFSIFLKKEFNKEFLSRKIFFVSGRIFRKRIMGKITFLHLKDFSGSIQLYISYSNLSEIYYDFLSNLNIGDIVGVYGKLFRTKTNEISLNVSEIYLLSKNYKTFPDKKSGVVDKDICYRQRYLDLMTNDESLNKFLIRSKILFFIRNFFWKRGYFEVETPIMQNIIGGADAKPFETYHNYLNSKLFLRVSPELYLKRLIVGGFEKVFEIGKSFRNEGLSIKHNPEFTMIEFYQAYSNYIDLIRLTQKFFYYLSYSIYETHVINYNGHIIDFSKKFSQVNFLEIISLYSGINSDDLCDISYIKNFFIKNNLFFDKIFKLEDFHSKLFDLFVEDKLINPTFVMHHPKDMSPLSRSTDNDESLTERFELYICGKEIANGFSELNDPTEQAKRFLAQVENKDEQYLRYDSDYIQCLMYGLPPTAGEGIGIDRVVMLFTNSSSIKDVLLFPTMKDK